jgi:hypothetical protein
MDRLDKPSLASEVVQQSACRVGRCVANGFAAARGQRWSRPGRGPGRDGNDDARLRIQESAVVGDLVHRAPSSVNDDAGGRAGPEDCANGVAEAGDRHCCFRALLAAFHVVSFR